MPWTDPTFDPTTGLDVGSANSQDQFYGYGTGLMNPDQIAIDMSERIHMVTADASPFFSWTSAISKSPTHNITFSWMEDEIFGHRDFRAKVRRIDLGAGAYLYTLKIPRYGDWQALEAALTADAAAGYSATKPFIHCEVQNVANGDVWKFAPLLPGLANGPKNREYYTGPATYKRLIGEIIIFDSRDTGYIGGNLAKPEVASLGPADFFDPTDLVNWTFPAGNEIEVYVHTVTPNDVLKGFPQGSGLPNTSYKRSRTFHNFVQIFKTPLAISNTTKAVRVYGGPQLARDRIRKASSHKVDIERAIIFQGGGLEGTAWGELPVFGFENPLTRFKGLGVGAAAVSAENVGWIATKNADIDTTFVLNTATAGPSEIFDLADAIFDDVVENPSDTKVVFASNKWFTSLAKMAGNSDGDTGSPFFGWREQSGSRLGLRINELLTPSGILRFVRMPHFRGKYEDYALVVDLKHMEIRTLRDTMFFADTAEKYIDGQLDYFITELGFECRHEGCHAILKLA